MTITHVHELARDSKKTENDKCDIWNNTNNSATHQCSSSSLIPKPPSRGFFFACRKMFSLCKKRCRLGGTASTCSGILETIRGHDGANLAPAQRLTLLSSLVPATGLVIVVGVGEGGGGGGRGWANGWPGVCEESEQMKRVQKGNTSAK